MIAQSLSRLLSCKLSEHSLSGVNLSVLHSRVNVCRCMKFCDDAGGARRQGRMLAADS